MRKQYHFRPVEDRADLDAWDVHRLIELSADLPVERVAVGELPELDQVYWFDEAHRPTVRAVIDHMRLTLDVDPSHPIILGSDGRVMDGMHRIARAVLEGRTHVDAVRFETDPEPDYRNCRPSDLPYD